MNIAAIYELHQSCLSMTLIMPGRNTGNRLPPYGIAPFSFSAMMASQS